MAPVAVASAYIQCEPRRCLLVQHEIRQQNGESVNVSSIFTTIAPSSAIDQ